MREYIKKPTFTAPLLFLAVGILAVLSKWLILRLQFNKTEDLFLAYTVMEILVFVLPGIFYVKMKPRGYMAELDLASFGFSSLPLILIMFFVMAFGGILLSLLFSLLHVQGVDTGLSQTALALTDGDYISESRNVIYVSLTLAVIPAIAEEFIFRGVLLKEYRSFGMLPSILVTSFLFAFLHLDFALFPFYFLAGIALGFVAYTARSTLAAVVLHILFNLFSLFGLPVVSNFISLAAGALLVFYLAMVLFLLFLMLALGEAERLFSNYSTAGLRSYAPVKRKGILPPFLDLVTPSLLLCLIFFVLGALKIIKLP